MIAGFVFNEISFDCINGKYWCRHLVLKYGRTAALMRSNSFKSWTLRCFVFHAIKFLPPTFIIFCMTAYYHIIVPLRLITLYFGHHGVFLIKWKRHPEWRHQQSSFSSSKIQFWLALSIFFKILAGSASIILPLRSSFPSSSSSNLNFIWTF